MTLTITFDPNPNPDPDPDPIQVTRLAYSIVTLYGMNDAIGNRSYPSNNQDGSLQHSRPYSEQTAELVDEEAGSRLYTHHGYTYLTMAPIPI